MTRGDDGRTRGDDGRTRSDDGRTQSDDGRTGPGTARTLVALAVVATCALALAAGFAATGAADDAAGVALAAPEAPDRAALDGSPLGDGVAQAGGDDGSGQVRGEPDLDVFLSQPTVPTGGDASVTLELLNTGEMEIGNELDPRVTTARSLRVEAEAENDGAPIEVTTDEVAVGDVPTGQPTPVQLGLTVPEDAEPGAYDVEVTARYRYTRTVVPSQNNHYDSGRTERFDVTVVVDDGPRFAIVDADTDAQVGGSGDVSMTMRNVGSESARDAYVTGSATGSGVVVGDGASDAYVGDWVPGENRTLTFDSTVTPEFAGDAYALQGVVTYRDAEGREQQSAPSRTGVSPLPEQAFSVGNVSGTLEVGYSGTVAGTVTNDGPENVDDAVLVAQPQTDRVQVGETRYALPDLAAGESADFSFDADVSGQADPGPRQFRFVVEYDGDSGTATDESSARVEVAERQPEFDVEAVDGETLRAGESGEVRFRVTNDRPERLTDVNAGLYADSPLSVVDDAAFIEGLDPGESREVRFELSTPRSTTPQIYPVELDFRYEDERGNDRISDVYQYPIDVTEPAESEGSPLPYVAVGVVALLLIGGGLWYRRR